MGLASGRVAKDCQPAQGGGLGTTYAVSRWGCDDTAPDVAGRWHCPGRHSPPFLCVADRAKAYRQLGGHHSSLRVCRSLYSARSAASQGVGPSARPRYVLNSEVHSQPRVAMNATCF
jgi:hypothetical protein